MLNLRLKKLRKKKGLVQRQVAEILNISIGTISGYERDHRRPCADMLKRLADFYETNVDYILGRTDDPSPTIKPKPPYSIEEVLKEPDLGKALVKWHDMRYEFNIPDDEYMRGQEIIARYFKGLPEPEVDSESAEGPKEPGTGVLKNDDDEKQSEDDDGD